MKFGKSYAAAMTPYPAEWKSAGIEYRKLKKVINRVAAELAELGLTSEVLRDLLEERQDHIDDHGAADRAEEMMAVRNTDEDGVERPLSDKAKGKQRALRRRRRPRASYEMAGTSDQPQPRIRIVFSSASSASTGSGSEEDSAFSNAPYALFRTHSFEADHSSDQGSSSTTPDRIVELDSEEEEEDAATARASGAELVRQGSADSASSSHEVSDRETFDGAGPKEAKLLKRMYGLKIHGGTFSDEEEVLERWSQIEGETGAEADVIHERRNSDETIRKERVRSHSTATVLINEPSADEGGEEADDEGADDRSHSCPSAEMESKRPRRHRHRQHRQEVFIPLTSDSEFLTLLAQALTSLAALQVAQKTQFAQAVDLLARQVSAVSSPARPKSDLYIWREIFSLWVQAQIFESERESDRGERNVAEAELKLGWFVDQVAKAGLAKKMRHKESRAALESFIKLNVELLDMKRFQIANEEAARKILKKHDKRTALNASIGFPQFIAAASNLSPKDDKDEDAGQQAISRVLHLPGATSLPHILLATFTNTLLPIIPSLDDYVCSICCDVAFKPIKLECGHKFCVRCLVKMQKRGQDACPQCRSKVVLRANATNLDNALQEFLKLWFPKEVKLKIKSNSAEAAKEELLEMGMADHKCLLQ